jgi:hypothetical protein
MVKITRSARAGLLLSVYLSGCAATTYADFATRRQSLNDNDVCYAWMYGGENNDALLEREARAEAIRRGLAFAKCVDSYESAKNTQTGLAVLAVVIAAFALAKRGGGGGGYASTPTDYEWDWDLFYNEYRQLVWACRGVQTGRFAEVERCQFKAKMDLRWPSLEAPR